jgi:hypothetical protein
MRFHALRTGSLRLLLLAGLALLLLSPAQAGDQIWSALVLATRESDEATVPRQLEEFAPTMRKIFGYNTFYLLGQKKADIKQGDVEWLVPSKRIFLKVAVLKRQPTSFRMKIELYDGESLLVTTEAVLARDAPLYIRGPQWGKGQLVILLEVR